jgi:predicted DsbA family dithiol-disulfide isomerase
MSEEIKITISDEGVKFESSGFSGGSCITEYEKLLKHLQNIGVDIKEIEQTLKSEMYSGGVTNDARTVRK